MEKADFHITNCFPIMNFPPEAEGNHREHGDSEKPLIAVFGLMEFKELAGF